MRDDPEAVSVVGNRNLCTSKSHCEGVCSEYTALRIVPQTVKVLEDNVETSCAEVRAVLDERPPRLDFSDDAGELSPEAAARPSQAGTASSGRDVLAWETARDHINSASPRVSVECTNVIPYREGFKRPVILAGSQDARGVPVGLHSADCLPSKERTAEDASSCPCEEGELA